MSTFQAMVSSHGRLEVLVEEPQSFAVASWVRFRSSSCSVS